MLNPRMYPQSRGQITSITIHIDNNTTETLTCPDLSTAITTLQQIQRSINALNSRNMSDSDRATCLRFAISQLR